MRKILLIARREYLALVATKAFILMIAMMPLLMAGSILVQKFSREHVDLTDKRILVLDGTDDLFGGLRQAAKERNRDDIFNPETKQQTKPRYLLEQLPKQPVTDALLLDLSDRIRRGEYDDLIVIPSGVYRINPTSEAPVQFFARNPAFAKERYWIQQKLTEEVRRRRLQELKIDPAQVAQASTPIAFENRGLVEQGTAGAPQPGEPKNEETAVILPFGVMMLMFMVILLGAQPMIESVIEEKSQRIAEILLGCVTPFQLMAGKLVGNVAGTLTVFAIYGAGGWGLAAYFHATHLLPLSLLPWFLIYQVLAVFFYSSIFMAVGACVSNRKEAQGLLMPITLFLVFPMVIWFNVVQNPLSDFSLGMSLIPPATPLLMILRLAASSEVPFWQPALGVLMMSAATGLTVFAAGRVFRIGILAQGKTPKLKQLLRWVVSG
jgi:ABC-2 type transport system permease protein